MAPRRSAGAAGPLRLSPSARRARRGRRCRAAWRGSRAGSGIGLFNVPWFTATPVLAVCTAACFLVPAAAAPVPTARPLQPHGPGGGGLTRGG
ncbi:hypothetical protein FGW37_30890 [Streptomyces rectiverticillatus]|nr:hypothetical protein FGW37_30890 [Streptomyces rectiverticillatus]